MEAKAGIAILLVIVFVMEPWLPDAHVFEVGQCVASGETRSYSHSFTYSCGVLLRAVCVADICWWNFYLTPLERSLVLLVHLNSLSVCDHGVVYACVVLWNCYKTAASHSVCRKV